MLKSKFKINFVSILKMISGENFEFKEFIEKSMFNKLIVNEQNHVKDELKKLGDIKLGLTKTPVEILEKYDEMKIKMNSLNSKKRKKMDREMKQLEESTKTFMSDYQSFIEYKTKLDKKKSKEIQLKNINGYIQDEVNIHLKILENEKFISKNDDEITLLSRGKYAIGLNEIHSLAMAEAIDLNIFQNLSPCELACTLSVFCDIRLNDQDKIFTVDYATKNTKIIEAVKSIKKLYNKYYDIETEYQTEFLFNYEIQYDLIEIVERWYKAENETECMNIINEAKKWGIEIGNYNKAIMKLCNIVNELESVCLLQENVDLKHRLHDIPENIMKFVINNQSLYL
jgi:hypothetical protein